MSGSVITCNDIPLVRETVSVPGTSLTSSAAVQEAETIDDDDDFVYDVYRTDDDQFDFQSLEHVLAIQAFRFSDQFHTASLATCSVLCSQLSTVSFLVQYVRTKSSVLILLSLYYAIVTNCIVFYTNICHLCFDTVNSLALKTPITSFCTLYTCICNG